MIEGSGSGSRAGSGSGSISVTSGSGSGRPKNIWIRWIRIRIQIRNTDWNIKKFSGKVITFIKIMFETASFLLYSDTGAKKTGVSTKRIYKTAGEQRAINFPVPYLYPRFLFFLQFERKGRKFFVGILKVNDENGSIRIRIRIRIPIWIH